jgi:hypothetical protein
LIRRRYRRRRRRKSGERKIVEVKEQGESCRGRDRETGKGGVR